jgi:hypothetical protein
MEMNFLLIVVNTGMEIMLTNSNWDSAMDKAETVATLAKSDVTVTNGGDSDIAVPTFERKLHLIANGVEFYD